MILSSMHQMEFIEQDIRSKKSFYIWVYMKKMQPKHKSGNLSLLPTMHQKCFYQVLSSLSVALLWCYLHIQNQQQRFICSFAEYGNLFQVTQLKKDMRKIFLKWMNNIHFFSTYSYCSDRKVLILSGTILWNI